MVHDKIVGHTVDKRPHVLYLFAFCEIVPRAHIRVLHDVCCRFAIPHPREAMSKYLVGMLVIRQKQLLLKRLRDAYLLVICHIRVDSIPCTSQPLNLGNPALCKEFDRGTKDSALVDLMLADWKQIVQEIKAFAEITDAYDNEIVSFQLVGI